MGPRLQQDDEYRLSVTTDAKLFGTFSGASGEAPVYSPQQIPLRTWTHVASTLDTAGHSVNLYINGVLVYSAPTNVVADRDTTMPVSIGFMSQDDGGPFSFDGIVDEAQIWNKALSPQEIQSVMDGELPFMTNHPPVANAGDDSRIFVGANCAADILLDAGGSYDPDGDSLAYTWTGPFGSATGKVITVSLPKGLHSLTLLVEDGRGGNDLDTVVIDVVDDTPPAFVVTPAPISIEQSSGAGTAVHLPPAIAIDNCGNVSVTSDAPAVFPLGTTTVTFTATDASGNRATTTTTVTVVDTTPPVLTGAPEPITAEQTNLAGTPVSIPLPGATDICDASPVITSDALDVFPLGTTTVTFAAKDASGNRTTATTTVTVVDTTPPVFIDRPDPITVEQTNRAGTQVTVPLPRARDICDAAPVVTCDALAVFPLGTTAVTCTATDASGNRSTATTTVTVVDTTPPVLTGVPGPITAEQISLAGTPVSIPLPGAADICDAAPVVTCDAPAVFPLGTTTVTCTATDASGNRSTATTTVTVVDTTAPSIINLAANPNVLWPPNHKMIPVTLTASVADICDAAPILKIVSVAANEGSISDWEITGNLTVNLRAERSGKGDRIYTITVQAMDASGNTSLKTVAVTVPHDQGK